MLVLTCCFLVGCASPASKLLSSRIFHSATFVVLQSSLVTENRMICLCTHHLPRCLLDICLVSSSDRHILTYSIIGQFWWSGLVGLPYVSPSIFSRVTLQGGDRTTECPNSIQRGSLGTSSVWMRLCWCHQPSLTDDMVLLNFNAQVELLLFLVCFGLCCGTSSWSLYWILFRVLVQFQCFGCFLHLLKLWNRDFRSIFTNTD